MNHLQDQLILEYGQGTTALQISIFLYIKATTQLAMKPIKNLLASGTSPIVTLLQILPCKFAYQFVIASKRLVEERQMLARSFMLRGYLF